MPLPSGSSMDFTALSAVREKIGRVGVFSAALQRQAVPDAVRNVQEWRDLGYRAVWIPEGPAGRDILSFASVLLAGSNDLVIASGVAVIWARDPVAMINGARTLDETFPGRFILGVGVSHPTTAASRGHDYTSPLKSLSDYLDRMAEAPYVGPVVRHVPIMVGALGPRMVELASRKTDGVHPFLTTPNHTAELRRQIGPDKLIAVEQGVVLASDLDIGIELASGHLGGFTGRENYSRHLRRIGFPDPDPSDETLIRALYAIGNEQEIVRRVVEHLDAGADHVCINVVAGDQSETATLSRLAPLLAEVD